MLATTMRKELTNKEKLLQTRKNRSHVEIDTSKAPLYFHNEQVIEVLLEAEAQTASKQAGENEARLR